MLIKRLKYDWDASAWAGSLRMRLFLFGVIGMLQCPWQTAACLRRHAGILEGCLYIGPLYLS